MIYLLSILFTVSFVYYSKWQFINPRAGAWHLYGAIMRILAIATPFIISYFPASVEDYILAGVINIILFDVLINIIALGVKWNYVGSTSKLDKFLGKNKLWIYLTLLTIAIIIKL